MKVLLDTGEFPTKAEVDQMGKGKNLHSANIDLTASNRGSNLTQKRKSMSNIDSDTAKVKNLIKINQYPKVVLKLIF